MTVESQHRGFRIVKHRAMLRVRCGLAKPQRTYCFKVG